MHEMWEMQQPPQSDRKYVIPTHSEHSPSPLRRSHGLGGGMGTGGGTGAAEDLHAWSIYRQNLNSDFTDSALGSDERSPLPYGNFQLREQTVQSILRHPRLAPRSELGSNMYAYLKFGLPRVFPPNVSSPPGRHPMHKDASSGYDSADERNQSPHQTAGHARSRSRMTDRGLSSGHHHTNESVLRAGRARSETDLREGMVPNRFTSATNTTGGGRKLRGANSEANLMHEQMRPISKNGSQISLVSRQSRPGLLNGVNPGFMSHKGGVINGGHSVYGEGSVAGGLDADSHESYFKHPHLQVRGLCSEASGGGSRGRVLDGISFDLRGGEIMALMTTTAGEGTALLDILAGRRTHRKRIGGEFLLNGNPVSLTRLGSRVAYVRRDYRMHPDITVAQTMRFHALLRKPIRTTSAHDKNTRINVLLEELGLASVRHSLVEQLTSAERQRLAVGCQLLLDTDIVLLDQPTRGMDIFDTFFLVDYLRQWSTRARIILMTIHPPTFEIFSMFTKVALTSMGRLMFYGHRREMLPYFAFIEYPCPGFKNPSDYYLDLVTLDDLSAEALLESSQRIETLADSYRRKQEPLSEPGPPSALPPKVKEAGAFMQIWAIWMYTIVFTFPWNIVRWLVFMLTSAALSILVGAIYWNVRQGPNQDQNSVNDRIGQHWTLMGLTPWPVILMLAARDVANIKYVTRDNEERLYSKGAYLLAKTIIELPFLVSIFLAYMIPAYVMAGISTGTNEMINFYQFVGYMLLYMYALRICLLAFTHLFRGLVVGTTLASATALALSLSAGYLVHRRDLGEWCSWVKYISPISCLFQPIIRDEFDNFSRFSCPKNPTVNQDLIVVQVECGVKDGKSALEYISLPSYGPIWIPLLASTGFILVFYILSFVGYILRRHAPSIPPPEKP
ncbi:unnamed protein product [Allacma fusca]|uniref:ABC transporter domain-containing protein n=1 Tax=Allacma fusca TaxID=39272 RepID=A0A8J2NVP9_9HEXA|nr:unnamed protein product [Allacma fusca]